MLTDDPEDANVAAYEVRKSPGGAWMIAKMITEKITMSSGSSSSR